MNILASATAIKASLLGDPSKPLPSNAQPVIQNLGPGDLYIGGELQLDAGSIVETGLQIPPNCVYELPASIGDGIHAIYWQVDPASGASADVRILIVG